ncbi:AfsR/SARP family transcriptional regulator [Pseudonocardia adelaidensis]|uniref:AfsR/SARP family transcriptional regulator n=1 Tax=Pseudonocardia adelaidensis TaxID=648754 RepID=UPI003CD0956C
MAGRGTPRDRTVDVVGTFAVHVGRQRLMLRPSVQRVIALLAVHGDLNRVDAAGLLWPDLMPSRGHANLRTVLWRVRHDAPGFVCEEGDVVGLSPDVGVDMLGQREWAWRALSGEDPWIPAPRSVGRELLPGWGDSWLVYPREELRLLHLYALEAAGQRLLMGGRHGEAAGLAITAVNIDPLRESANRLLIEIHLRDGNRLDALRHFRQFRTLLLEETDTDPSPSLTSLVEAATTDLHSTAGLHPNRAAPPRRGRKRGPDSSLPISRNESGTTSQARRKSRS